MKSWRLVFAALLLGLIGVPLGLPALALLRQPDAWHVWDESDRLIELAKNTGLLVAGTLTLALPIGVVGAVLLYRSDLPGRRALRFLTVLTLFVPLPLFASAWQATLGSGGWLTAIGWFRPDAGPARPGATADVWQPWMQGLGAAIWVHAMAGLPWVVWLVGQGLSWVERDLEEEALLAAPPWRVLLHVTLPRCRAAIVAAALVVAVQTATEITVTDMMQVRTFAEEVYMQFILQDRAVLARAVAIATPAVVLMAFLVVAVGQRWERTLPALEQLTEPLCLLRLGAARWPVLCVVLLTVGVLAGVPVIALVWRTGLGGSPELWSAERVGRQLLAVLQGKGFLLMENLLLVVSAGVVAAGAALVCCWLATESGWFRAVVFLLMAVALALPGSVVGIGLKETISRLVDAEETVQHWLGSSGSGPLRLSLYDGPSMLPVLWVSLIRFFPFAVAVLWPAVRMLPRELRDAARVDGARPVDELLRIMFPLTRPACIRAGLAVAVLSLGELSAGKLVETPGSTTLSHVIFEQMHRGVPSDVAALCLVLLLFVALGGGLLAGVSE